MKQEKEEKQAPAIEIKERPKNIKEELAGEHSGVAVHMTNLLSQTTRTILNARAAQFHRQLQRTHRLGNWLGKFHPSKSKKGIKRSE
ncbi:MAG: hypothetical protein ACYDFU_09345 [Nitrospirota bacterium]